MFEIKKINERSDGIPIALVYNKKDVKGGTPLGKPKKIIYSCDYSDSDSDSESDVDYNQCPKCKKHFSSKFNTNRHIKNSCPFYKVVQKSKPNEKVNEIKLNKDEIICSQFPNPKLRDICYVAAPYGAGKSTYTENYIKSFMELFDKDIFLISRIEDDKAFRDLIDNDEMQVIDIQDESLLEYPLGAKEDLYNSLVIFDDYELLDKDIQKSIEITLKDVILNGRDQADKGNDIYAVITAHQISNYSKTRDILNECSSITIFPNAGSTYHIKRVLKEYCGFSKKDINKILKLGRWVTIYKRAPQWVLYNKGVFKPS